MCVSCASTGLCGGQRVTAVPTATARGNPGHGQGVAYGLPRQFPTLPGSAQKKDEFQDTLERDVAH